jgi:hypothetical protein
MELCPAIRASVQASQPDSPRRVRKVCRSEYSTNFRTALPFPFAALFCQYFKHRGVLLLETDRFDVSAFGGL